MTNIKSERLKQIYSNIKNFFILDVNRFIDDMDLDMERPSTVYIINDEIRKLILSQAKLKKNKGIIYINDNLSHELCDALKSQFGQVKEIKMVLIDNGDIPEHEDIMDCFDEIIFFYRFKKNKIIECTGFEHSFDSNKIVSIEMDTIDTEIT